MIRLLETIAPRFEEIEAELAALGELRGKPAGTIRITAGEHPAISILQPALRRFLPDHPDIKVEIIVDYGLTDIVAAGYDAGVRLGEQVAKDMIAVRIGPDMRMAVVGSPSYFERHGLPTSPQDLTTHNCIVTRLPTYGGLFPWGLEKDGHEVKVRGEGQLVFNNLAMRVQSALDGLGLAYLPEDQVLPHVREGRLVRVLEDWCPPFPGYHLYYPSRRQSSPALVGPGRRPALSGLMSLPEADRVVDPAFRAGADAETEAMADAWRIRDIRPPSPCDAAR